MATGTKDGGRKVKHVKEQESKILSLLMPKYVCDKVENILLVHFEKLGHVIVCVV